MKPLFIFGALIVVIVRAQSPLQVEVDKGFFLSDGDDFSAASGNPDSDPPLLQASAGAEDIGLLDDPSLPWRLPQTIWPELYTLTISPILVNPVPGLGEAWKAPGTVTMQLHVLEATNLIKFHTAYADSLMTSILLEDYSTGGITTIVPNYDATTYNATTQIYTITTALTAGGQYGLKIDFISDVKGGGALDGLYRSSYYDPISNTTKWVATTQMEAIHARQMFPCFDEPTFKTRFEITLGHHRDDIALTATPSNGIQRPMPGVPEWVTESFQVTIPMPTYLLAVIISQFTFTEAPSDLFRGVVRTYAPKHFMDRDGGTYAAEMVAKTLAFFEGYYRERYPLPKMDSAAVPTFSFGAMENYGLNIYRETALLYLPDESEERERFSITRVIAHEIGHQWFGNIVSPKWWTHIWLNEGFATYIAKLGTDAVAPEFESYERFQNDAVQNSMGFDSRADYSHSVKIGEVEWATRGTMDWFDRMAYEKAGSLNMMMSGFLSEEVFVAGLQTYLKNMTHMSAVQDDLFAHLNVAAKGAGNKIPADLTMKDIMDTWTLQPGYPLIRVSVADANGIFISQERFLNNEVTTGVHINQDTGLWHVPLTFASASQPNYNGSVVEWLSKDVAMKYRVANPNAWIVVNSGANGFYRVLYDTRLTSLLKAQLETNHTFISPRTRSQLLDDYFTAAWQKYISLDTALSLSHYLANETDIVVWNAVLNNFRTAYSLFPSAGGSYYSDLRAYLLPRLQSAVRLTGGVDNPALPETMGGMPVIRHQTLLDWLCGFEDDECVAYSVKVVNEWRADANKTVRRDVKPITYCAAAAHGGDAVLTFLHSQYLFTNLTSKQSGILLNSLACVKEPSQVALFLEETVKDGENFFHSTTDRRTLLGQLARNVVARPDLVSFIRNNDTADYLDTMGVTTIPNIITAMAAHVSTQAELDLITQYVMVERPTYGLRTDVQAALATMKRNIQWVADFGGPMSNLRSF